MTTTTTSTPGTIDNVPPPRPRRQQKVNIGRILAWALLVLAIIVTVFPFYWVLRTALSTPSRCPPTRPPAPGRLQPRRLQAGLRPATTAEALAEGGSGAAINFWLYLRNSVIFSTITTAGQVFFSAMAAYAFSRLRWQGRDKVFGLFLATMLVPPIFTALPNFLLIKNLGLLNTILGLVLPYLFMTPFAIFFLRQFFLNITREVEEAAMLDGAKHWRIFFRIILPNAAPRSPRWRC